MLCFCFPLFWMIGIFGTIFWLWMLVDCATRIHRGEQNLVGWLVVVACTHLVGAMIYYLCARNPGPPRY
jgi:hypothetical protein